MRARLHMEVGGQTPQGVSVGNFEQVSMWDFGFLIGDLAGTVGTVGSPDLLDKHGDQ